MQERRDIASAQSTVTEILREDRSLYSTQFALGFRSLRFIPELEASFREFYLQNNPGQLKRIIPFAVLLTLLFSVADYVRLPDAAFEAIALPRLIQLVSLIGLSIPIYLGHHRIVEICVIIVLAVYGITTPIMHGIINQNEVFSPVSTQLIILAFCYFLAGLRFFHAALTGAVISIAYPTSQLMFSYPLPNLGLLRS